MDRNKQLDLAEKYIKPFNWFIEITANDMLDGKSLVEQIKSELIAITDCSSEKFDQLHKKGFMDFDYELIDQPLVETFWKIVESIRKAHQ
jgi:hypothetical protein